MARGWNEGIKIKNGCTSLEAILDNGLWRPVHRVGAVCPSILRYGDLHCEYARMKEMLGGAIAPCLRGPRRSVAELEDENSKGCEPRDAVYIVTHPHSAIIK